LKDNKLATKEAGKALAAALAGNSVLTELDVSSNNWYNHEGDKGDGAGFAQELAAGIKDNGALLCLDMSSNNIGEGLPVTDIALLEAHGWRYAADINGKMAYFKGGTGRYQPPKLPLGAITLVNAIKNMGAMTSLNLALNRLGVEGAKIVAEAIKVTICTLAIIMAPFSCPSDFSNNCCCLLLSAGYGGDDEPEFVKQ
jgi:hypothetical protein